MLGSDIFTEEIINFLFKSLDSLIDLSETPQTERIVNLSSHGLNPDELSLLERGLNFCPTPGEPKMGDLVHDLDHFHDTLRWEYHFKNNPMPSSPFEKLILTSKVLKKPFRTPPSPAIRL